MGAPKGNKFAQGLTESGRPPVYQTPEDLKEQVYEYFEYILGEYRTETNKWIDEKGKEQSEDVEICIRKPEAPTMTGLALFLGFSSRQSMYDYKSKKEFSYIIKRATMIIENHHECRLDGDKTTGSIFALKNMGWTDKQEVHQTVQEIKPLSQEEINSAKDKLEGDY